MEQHRWAGCVSRILQKYRKLDLKINWMPFYTLLLTVHFKRFVFSDYFLATAHCTCGRILARIQLEWMIFASLIWGRGWSLILEKKESSWWILSVWFVSEILRRYSYEGLGLKMHHLDSITTLVRCCRRYFQPDSAIEIWSEFRYVLYEERMDHILPSNKARCCHYANNLDWCALVDRFQISQLFTSPY